MLSETFGRRQFLAAATGIATFPFPSHANVVPPPCEDQEKFLSTAKVTRRRSAGLGITGSQRLTMELDGLVHEAHWQVIDEFKTVFQGARGTEMNFRDTYKYNIAGYHLDRMLDMNMIPVSVKRRLDGSEGSVTWWVDDVMMNGLDRYKKKIEPPDKDRWNRQMFVAHVFDQLIANTDRNLGNFVITKDWTVWLVDHTRAFRAVRGIPEPKNLTKCCRALLERLRTISKDEIETKLSPWVGKFEMQGLLARKDLIVAHFDKRIASQGESNVLYDYLPARKTEVGRA